MGVTVAVVMVVSADGFEFGWSRAAMSGFAAGDLELDGGVVDVKAVAEGGIDAGEDVAALGHGHLGDGDVAGEGVGVRAEGPDVKVVDVEDAFDGLHGLTDCGELEAARRAFEEDVEGFADDADGAPEDHCSDDDGEDGVDPHHAGEEDGGATGNDGSGGESVAEHVEEDAADVDVSV